MTASLTTNAAAPTGCERAGQLGYPMAPAATGKPAPLVSSAGYAQSRGIDLQ